MPKNSAKYLIGKVYFQLSSIIFIGKSTIAGLIERFYDVHNGEITIDGVNIKQLDPSWMRGELIGYINQVS